VVIRPSVNKMTGKSYLGVAHVLEASRSTGPVAAPTETAAKAEESDALPDLFKQ
jgi:hypothetical protein